jgi:ubiquinone/menaquinone biosynthesis C-methylase UbiE
MQIDPQNISALLNNLSLEEPDKQYIQFHINRYTETLSIIPVSSKTFNVLDIGAFRGHLSILVKKAFDCTVHALDVNASMRHRLAAEGIELKTCDISREPLPYDTETFDVVLFCETLEHLTISPYIVLTEVRRVLKENGVLVLSTPNIAALVKRLKLLIGRSPLHPFTNSHNRTTHSNDLGHDHVHEYTKSEIKSVLEHANFAIDKLYLSDCWEKTFSNMNPVRLVYKLLMKMVPSFRGCIIARARKCTSIDGAGDDDILGD